MVAHAHDEAVLLFREGLALGVSVLELELLPRARIPLHLPCYEAGFEPHVVVQISSLTCRETGFQPSPAVGQVLSLSCETGFEPNITEQVASLDHETRHQVMRFTRSAPTTIHTTNQYFLRKQIQFIGEGLALGVSVLELELLPRACVPLHLPGYESCFEPHTVTQVLSLHLQ